MPQSRGEGRGAGLGAAHGARGQSPSGSEGAGSRPPRSFSSRCSFVIALSAEGKRAHRRPRARGFPSRQLQTPSSSVRFPSLPQTGTMALGSAVLWVHSPDPKRCSVNAGHS